MASNQAEDGKIKQKDGYNAHSSYLDKNDLSSTTDSSCCSDEETGKVGREVSSASSPSQPRFAVEEQRSLRNCRRIISVMMVFTAAIVATAANLFLRNKEYTAFRTNYYESTDTIQDATQVQVNSLLQSYSSLSEVLTASGGLPFTPIPLFDIIATHARRQSNKESCLFTPMVKAPQKSQWENYSVVHWTTKRHELLNVHVTPFIFEIDKNDTKVPSSGPAPYWPVWATSPPPKKDTFVNYDMASTSAFRAALKAVEVAKAPIFSDFLDVFSENPYATLVLSDEEEHNAFHEQFVEWEDSSASEHPHTVMIQPVFDSLGSAAPGLAGTIQVMIAWDAIFSQVLPTNAVGIFGVLTSTCGGSDDKAYTYISGVNKPFYLGEGDLHEEKYDSMKVSIPFRRTSESAGAPAECQYWMNVYPSAAFQARYHSDLPVKVTFLLILVFVVIGLVFLTFNRSVELRNNKVVSAALKGHHIVSSLFPSNVRNRLFEDEADGKEDILRVSPYTNKGINRNLKQFLHEADSTENEEDGTDGFKSKPIADLFPATTVFFADIAGFTAWSSSRDPSSVFLLLESLYSEFDKIARRRRVFKVETVGDCYVAVTGLPEPRKDHAVAMARFARDCMKTMKQLTKDLVVTLGPDTCDLTMRVGMHSGPVTAGVLRGDRARFQLFGDTVNTASRMESTSEANKIQISRETAELLIAADKEHWLEPRKDQVLAKGKGYMKTFWLLSSGGLAKAAASVATGLDELDQLQENGAEMSAPVRSEKINRLIRWNAEVLMGLLRDIAACRQATCQGNSRVRGNNDENTNNVFARPPNVTVLEEVKEIVNLPTFAQGDQVCDPKTVKLHPNVESQLLEFVAAIASMYKDNPFHNFEHASHVMMSVVKLMARIIAPDLTQEEKQGGDLAAALHDHTYGITSDPLTQFACAFSALIHDVDHSGVPNSQLLKENPQLSGFYKNRSVAEQNSVDIAWELLMDDIFVDLRNAICQTLAEQKRFRQLVVNAVMATDIMDRDLKALRNARWEKAFSQVTSRDACEESLKDAIDRKATIVIEHLIQASDVSHTMQHWQIYRKWNELLFQEMYKAYLDGRAECDPSETWYQGEIGFFDFYIVPLAKKLKDCGVFGVSSDEYLMYAQQNRTEWEERGQEMMKAYKETANQKWEVVREEEHMLNDHRGDSGEDSRSKTETDNLSSDSDEAAEVALPQLMNRTQSQKSY